MCISQEARHPKLCLRKVAQSYYHSSEFFSIYRIHVIANIIPSLTVFACVHVH